MTDKDYTPEEIEHHVTFNETDVYDDLSNSGIIIRQLQRQLAERDAEIERLKIDNEFLYSFVSCGTKYQIANHFRHKEPKP